MHEVYYLFGKKMQFGLWDFKDNDWHIRPIYHWLAARVRDSAPDPDR